MIDQVLLEKTCEAVRAFYGQDIQPSSIGFEKTKKEIPGDFTIVVFPLPGFPVNRLKTLPSKLALIFSIICLRFPDSRL